jgi:hypothetical protein
MNDANFISLNDYIRHLQFIAAKGYGDCAVLVTAPGGEGYALVAGAPMTGSAEEAGYGPLLNGRDEAVYIEFA